MRTFTGIVELISVALQQALMLLVASFRHGESAASVRETSGIIA